MDDEPTPFGYAVIGGMVAIMLMVMAMSVYYEGANSCLRQEVAVCVGKVK